MPAVPSCLLKPAWVEFSALIGGDRPQSKLPSAASSGLVVSLVPNQHYQEPSFSSQARANSRRTRCCPIRHITPRAVSHWRACSVHLYTAYLSALIAKVAIFVEYKI
jgi:hypothetical protein